MTLSDLEQTLDSMHFQILPSNINSRSRKVMVQ